MNKRRKINELWHKCRNVFACGLFLAGTATTNIYFLQKEKSQKDLLRNYSMIEAFRHGLCNSIGGYIAQADYLVDTVPVNRQMFQKGTAKHQDGINSAKAKKGSVFINYGIYEQRNGKRRVVLKYFVPDTLSESNLSPYMKKKIIQFAAVHNDSIQQKMILAHEFIHQARFPNRDAQRKLGKKVAEKSIFDYNVTPLEDAKLCYHNEISGDINAFLMLREMYLECGDLAIFKGQFPQYVQAVKAGRLHPGSASAAEKQKERLFIARYLTDLWKKEKNNYYENYAETQTQLLVNKNKYQKGLPLINEYNQALDFCYTFIIDGELANLNYISNGEIKDVAISARVQEKIRTMLDKKGLAAPYQRAFGPINGNER